MATERGIVVRSGLRGKENLALVKTVQASACEACSSRDKCNPNVRGAEREVKAINLVDARAGDLIQISMDNRALLKATFLLYVFPIICMLIGAMAGHAMGAALDMNTSALSASIGIASFIAAMVLVRRQAGYMALKQKYQPKITRIIGRGNSDPTESCDLQATRSA